MTAFTLCFVCLHHKGTSHLKIKIQQEARTSYFLQPVETNSNWREATTAPLNITSWNNAWPFFVLRFLLCTIYPRRLHEMLGRENKPLEPRFRNFIQASVINKYIRIWILQDITIIIIISTAGAKKIGAMWDEAYIGFCASVVRPLLNVDDDNDDNYNYLRVELTAQMLGAKSAQ
jgi:hypothetical protein